MSGGAPQVIGELPGMGAQVLFKSSVSLTLGHLSCVIVTHLYSAHLALKDPGSSLGSPRTQHTE